MRRQARPSGLTDAQMRAASVPVSGPVTGTFWQATQPVSIAGIVATKSETAHGKQLTFVVVNQTVAGTTVLAAAVTGKKHKILGAILTTSLLGTVKFTDDAGDLIGPMDVAASQPFVLPTSVVPYQETGATNRALNLVSTVGAVRGVVVIVTEP